MARPSNNFDSVSMTIAVTPQIKMYLEDLIVVGTYGSSPAEAAKILLGQVIEEKLSKGVIEKRKFTIQDGEVQSVPIAA